MLRRFFSAAAGKIGHHRAACSFKEDFYRLVGKENVLDTAIDPYVTDWTRKHVGGNASTLVVFPRSAAHVSAVLSFCHTNMIGVVPQGGNTGKLIDRMIVISYVFLLLLLILPLRALELIRTGGWECTIGWRG